MLVGAEKEYGNSASMRRITANCRVIRHDVEDVFLG